LAYEETFGKEQYSEVATAYVTATNAAISSAFGALFTARYMPLARSITLTLAKKPKPNRRNQYFYWTPDHGPHKMMTYRETRGQFHVLRMPDQDAYRIVRKGTLEEVIVPTEVMREYVAMGFFLKKI